MRKVVGVCGCREGFFEKSRRKHGWMEVDWSGVLRRHCRWDCRWRSSYCRSECGGWVVVSGEMIRVRVASGRGVAPGMESRAGSVGRG